MQRLPILLILTLISCIASGCGQKGPLYLPEQETPVAGTKPAVDPVPEDDQEQKDKPGEKNP